ncbi:MAG: translational GTPase TypA [Flavobacteriales bacterium]|nr:translational GTPase TypA [Flavobacteriales bacterium]MDW8433123.1 translational GTPase TypA [Flavobacteriales bacterium]
MTRPLRNVAIIAHVDHGKTTLVDKIMHQCRLFRDNQHTGELILDHNELERERGITILAKNISVTYKGIKINIIDTPGHADFGGEVERVLNMADGALLLVDAFEGPMPQTRYVLQKALDLGKKIILVVNKIDKENCRPLEVQEAVFELMFHLGASEEQLDFPTLFGSSKLGWMSTDPTRPEADMTPLLDTLIATVPPPSDNPGSLQMQITSLDYSSFLGRIAIGRVHRGTARPGMEVLIMKPDGSSQRQRIKELFVFEGLEKQKTDAAPCGEICAVTGLESFDIGDTIADPLHPEALPAIQIDEPTMSMVFTINNSPFFGRDGRFVTSRHLRERLLKETEKNLALRVEEGQSADSFVVYGRGVLHLSILVETMRREGYELQVGKPRVLLRDTPEGRMEPIEWLVVDSPEYCAGKIIESVSRRKGELKNMETRGDMQRMEFEIPARGLIGLRTEIINLSSGEALMGHRFLRYDAWRGPIPGRINGSLISGETGVAAAYSLDRLQDRGKFFIHPGEEVYEGQVIGEHTRDNDLVVNVTLGKKLTNMRASGADEKMRIAPPVKFTLEEAMEYINEDEYVEITPAALRLRKIFLNENDRKRMAQKAVIS